MASQADVRRISLGLPETSEEAGNFAFFVRNGAKLKRFAWAWHERVEPKKPRVPRQDVLVVRVSGEEEKELLLRSDPEKFFTEPHYNGFPAILVRLGAIDTAELEELVTDAWRCQAPRSLSKRVEREADG